LKRSKKLQGVKYGAERTDYQGWFSILDHFNASDYGHFIIWLGKTINP
jgi:hypothetical protein